MADVCVDPVETAPAALTGGVPAVVELAGDAEALVRVETEVCVVAEGGLDVVTRVVTVAEGTAAACETVVPAETAAPVDVDMVTPDVPEVPTVAAA